MRILISKQVRHFSAYEAQDISQRIYQDAINLANALEFREISQEEAQEQFAELKEQLEEAKAE